MLLTILGTCLVIFVAVIGYNLLTSSNLAVESAGQLAEAESEKHAKSIEAELNFTLDIAKALAVSFETLVEEEHAERHLVISTLRNILEENEAFIATWTAWEPNAFDGLDEEFVHADGHDETGRFVPYWSRSGSRVMLTPLENKADEDVEALGSVSDHVNKVVNELQEHMLKVRMVPIDQLFNRFPRMVRDLSRSLHKQVNFKMTGHVENPNTAEK